MAVLDCGLCAGLTSWTPRMYVTLVCEVQQEFTVQFPTEIYAAAGNLAADALRGYTLLRMETINYKVYVEARSIGLITLRHDITQQPK